MDNDGRTEEQILEELEALRSRNSELRCRLKTLREMHEALYEKEERFHRIIENLDDLVCETDSQGRYCYISPSYERILGYAPHDLLGGSVFERIHPDDRPRVTAEFEAGIRTHTILKAELRYRHANGSYVWLRSVVRFLYDASGNFTGAVINSIDMTERKQVEVALEKRILALTKPLDNPESIAFEDLFDLSELQRLQDLYADAFGVAALITRPNGTPITQPSNFSSFCADIIRKNPKGRQECEKSDATIGRHNPSGPIIQKCLSAGLCNAGASITLGGRHVANWLIGQVRNEAQDEEEILTYCREIGSDENAFLAAYSSIPIMSSEQFEKAARVVFEVAKQISTSAYQNVQQARFIADRMRAEEISRKYLQELEAISHLGRAMSSKLSLHDVVEVGLKELIAVVKSDWAMLFLRKDSQLILEGFVSSANEACAPEFPIHRVGECLCGLCAQRRAAIFSLDANDDPRCTWEECKRASLKSIAALPLLAGNEVLGVLCLGSRVERDFSCEEKFIQSLNHEITMAVKNSLLFEDIRNHGLELEKKLLELKRSNEDRDSLQSQLVQAQKMEAVGILSGGIAHDFNNLLQVIRGYADLLLFRLGTGSKEYGHVREIKRATEQAAELTAGLLTFSRQVESKRRPIDVNSEIRQVVEMLKRTIPKMVKIEVDLEENIHTLNADPSQLQQVLMNLALNAGDAMPEGGRLVIESRNITLDEDYCRTHLGTKAGNYVLLAVSDTGSGMDSATKERIFDPFFTTKMVGKGTGLGLSVAYGIIKSHYGHILCYSEPGLGTTFKIYLPAAVEEGVIQCDAEEHELARGGTETVLIVDDESRLRDSLAETLSSFGYQVLTASNGKEGIDLFRERIDEIDLVVLDLIMPEMSGTKTLEHILQLRPSTKVIISSGYSVNGQLEEARKAGAVSTIGKPYDARQLLVQVRKALDSE